ncbi:uncharacterized protein LOC112558434 isoform X2 [Pomacea canaliculata]|nr:uncharacterized protein LOC112558434 isoform X2 [Pomacea canaliculata]
MADQQKVKKYYIRGRTLSFEEDGAHEFKGHRNLCVEEIPYFSRGTDKVHSSRKAISRNLNAFLNSGKGGTVYLGVSDDGSVHGLKMSHFQKEHFLESLDDLMMRYEPTVAPHRYNVKFIPVIEQNTTEADILKLCTYDSSFAAASLERNRKHVLRNPCYCWCDKEAVAAYNCGLVTPDYVVEVVIQPWKRDDPRNVGLGLIINIHPLHKDEEGKIYFRRQASVVQYSLNSLVQITKQEVKELCEGEIARLKGEIALLKQRRRLLS